MKDVASSEKLDGIQCLFCAMKFSVDVCQRDIFLKHLVEKHNFVIGEVQLVCDFERYISYWRQRFKEQPLSTFCAVIKTNSGDADIGPQEKYHLLCDKLPEDKTLREKLQHDQLMAVLEQHQKERRDTNFSRGCLFCRAHFKGNRRDLLNHMNTEHNFNVGLSDNLVYTNQLLDMLEDKLHKLQCLYCERIFKDRSTLTDHMRKKRHKKIDPQNEMYDKFYLINYLELGKSWKNIHEEEDDLSDSEKDDEWREPEEDIVGSGVCLFCDTSAPVTDQLLQHMKDVHHFDLKNIKSTLSLNFYQQIKLVNFIRRQVHHMLCIGCHEKFAAKADLLTHMLDRGHTSTLLEIGEWDQPQYFFPTYENDSLLFCLDDGDNDSQDCVVIGEEMNILQTLEDRESDLRQLVTNWHIEQ